MGSADRLRARTCAAALAAGLLVAGCQPDAQPSGTRTFSSADGVPHYADTARGDASFARYVLGGRVTRILDVTSSYPDRHLVVAGAFVLVDQRAGRRWPADDYTHRPVVVRYTSTHAARAAVRGHDPHSYGLRRSTVLWIPAGLPAGMTADYRQTMSAGLG